MSNSADLKMLSKNLIAFSNRHKFSVWAWNMWNPCDGAAIILFFIGLSLRFRPNTMDIGRVIYCVDSIYWYLRILNILGVNKYLGKFSQFVARFDVGQMFGLPTNLHHMFCITFQVLWWQWWAKWWRIWFISLSSWLWSWWVLASAGRQYFFQIWNHHGVSSERWVRHRWHQRILTSFRTPYESDVYVCVCVKLYIVIFEYEYECHPTQTSWALQSNWNGN